MNELRRRIDEELSGLTFDSIPESKRKALPTTRKERSMKLNKKALAICAAAVVAVGCAITAGAVSGWDYSRLIRGFFPGTESAAQAEALEGTVQMIDPQNISNSFENYDVSFDGAIFDGNVLMVSATVRSKDGVSFEDSNYDFNKIAFPEGTRGGAGGCDLNDDGTLRIYNIMTYSSDDKAPVAKYTFEGLCRYPDWPERYETLDSGSLTAEFPLEKRCETRSIMLKDKDGGMIEAVISPISVKLVMPESVAEEDADKYKSITIMGEDGVIFSTDDFNIRAGLYDPETGLKSHIFGFPNPIDINAVTAITGEAYISE